MAKNTEEKEERKPIPFVLLDETVTTYGFRVLLSGVDTTQFERNPVMFYRHNDYSLPIGTWSNIRKEKGQLLADANFDYDDPDLEVQRIIGKVERGIIKMSSIGLRDPEASFDEAYKVEGQVGATIIRSRAREASIVPIGANNNAFAIRLYDREDYEIDLSDEIKLSDFLTPKVIKKTMNEELLKLLNLSDGAGESDVLTAVKALNQEKIELADKLREIEEKEKAHQSTEAIRLVDAGITSGKINNDSEGNTRKKWLELFDADFAGTKNLLASIPERKSVKEQIDMSSQGNDTELADMKKQGWDELDKSGKLVKLKDTYPDVYKEMYKEKFGVDPVI